MQTLVSEPVHTRFIPDKSHIITDIHIRRDNILETLEDAIAYNLTHASTKIKLDAFEEGIFITACAKALNELDKKDPERAQQLLLGLESMLDKV